jgi:hypothetical protein
MRALLSAGLAAGAFCAWGVATSAAAPSPAHHAHQGTGVAAELAGTWTGHRTIRQSGRTDPLQMTWLKGSDGRVTGTVAVAREKYPMTVVWSSDTAFIAESAPHHSRVLNEMVVTRTVGHLKGTELVGTFEARPTAYSGRALAGSFEVTRS